VDAGRRHAFVEAVKKKAMAEGGRWVWQADKPAQAPACQRAPPQIPRGRALGNQPFQGQFPRPPPPQVSHHQQNSNQVQGESRKV
jgi:hypothetical protein